VAAGERDHALPVLVVTGQGERADLVDPLQVEAVHEPFVVVLLEGQGLYVLCSECPAFAEGGLVAVDVARPDVADEQVVDAEVERSVHVDHRVVRIRRLGTDESEGLHERVELALRHVQLQLEALLVGHCDQVLQLEAVHTGLELIDPIGLRLEPRHLILERIEALGDGGVVGHDGLLRVVGAPDLRAQEHAERENQEEADEERVLAGSVDAVVHSRPLNVNTHSPLEPPESEVCVFGLEKSRKEDECPTFCFVSNERRPNISQISLFVKLRLCKSCFVICNMLYVP